MKRPISYGDTILDILQLLFEDGKPTVLWSVNQRGGYSRVNGAGAHVTIPPEMLPSLTAESLIAWMMNTLKTTVMPYVNLQSFTKDERVVDWCDTVRHMYQTRED